MVAAKTMALDRCDLSTPATIAAAKAEFDTKRGPAFKYETALGSQPPSRLPEGQRAPTYVTTRSNGHGLSEIRSRSHASISGEHASHPPHIGTITVEG